MGALRPLQDQRQHRRGPLFPIRKPKRVARAVRNQGMKGELGTPWGSGARAHGLHSFLLLSEQEPGCMGLAQPRGCGSCAHTLAHAPRHRLLLHGHPYTTAECTWFYEHCWCSEVLWTVTVGVTSGLWSLGAVARLHLNTLLPIS